MILVRHGREVFRPCQNIAVHPTTRFRIAKADLLLAMEQGATAILHSHPGASSDPSMIDRAGCEETGLRWIILGLPDGDVTTIEPSGYEAPLVGRPYVFGVFDCWSLIRDYFIQEIGIPLPDFERREDFWLRGENLYLDHAEEAGFVRVPEECLREHDVVLMALNSPIPNHGSVYVGDMKILHHRTNRLSGHDVFGGYWQKSTTHVFRHRSLV